MAKLMPFDDQYGNHYETSYWRLVQMNIGIADRTAMATFYGYRDQASRAANKQSIGSKNYSVSGERFDQLMAEHLTPGGPNIMALAYKIATETRDVVLDPKDPSKNVSFFEGAQDEL